MPSHRESLATRFLKRLSDSVYRHPALFLYPQLLFFAVCVIYSYSHLQLNTSRNDLVGKDKKYHQNFLRFKEEFPLQDDLVVVAESEDHEKNRQFVERLGMKLEQETNLFTGVFYKGDLRMLGNKALLFIDAKTLGVMKTALTDYRPFIDNFSSATNLNSMFRLINRQFRTAKREANAENESLMKAIPALEGILKQANDSLHRPGTPPSPGISALFGNDQEAEQEMYVTFDHGRIYLVNAHALREDLNFAAVERLRQLVKATQAEVQGLNIGITGEPVLEFDEMAQSKHDATIATVVSLILCALIFIYGYQETGRPLKATFCLVIGLGYTLGFTTLVIGHLNILTITFLPMLIGLCIDFGVHLISRYEEELHRGRTEREALEKAMVYTGMGIFTGCFTTAGAFLAMGLTNFKGIQEMGIISGCGLLICLVPMMTLLPILLLRGRQNVMDKKIHDLGRRSRIEQYWLSRPIAAICVTVAISALALTQVRRVYFDYNLLNMQSEGLPAVLTEKLLIKSATNSVIFGVVVADTLAQADALEQRLTNLTTVASVRSMSSYLSLDQTERLPDRPAVQLATNTSPSLSTNQIDRLALVGEIKRIVADIHFAPLDLASVDLPELDQTLLILQGYLSLAIEEVKKENNDPLAKSLASLRGAVRDLREGMAHGDRLEVATKLGAFQRALFDDFRETLTTLQNQDNSGPLRASDLPKALRDRFIGKTGKYLLQVYPKEDVWQRANQEAFVRQLRTVDPNVTGTPVQLYEYTSLLKSSYQEAALYALAAIALLVLIHFHSLICVILALLPVGVGTLWMIGIMGVVSVPFNPADLMTLPLVIGIGVTSGIHILNRFSEEQTPSILAKSTGLAVIVSALTTVAGFGSLVLAKHQGMRSLGFVMAVGTTTCMVVAITFLPAVIVVLSRIGWKMKKPSAENAHSSPG